MFLGVIWRSRGAIFLRMDRVSRFSVHVQHKVRTVKQKFAVVNMHIYNTNKINERN
jgi:hypothetical protein